MATVAATKISGGGKWQEHLWVDLDPIGNDWQVVLPGPVKHLILSYKRSASLTGDVVVTHGGNPLDPTETYTPFMVVNTTFITNGTITNAIFGGNGQGYHTLDVDSGPAPIGSGTFKFDGAAVSAGSFHWFKVSWVAL